MTLAEEIEKMRKEIRTDGYSMSIGEWISLYETNEINIHPEFQRFFRWDSKQKSAFVESICLGIPIPPIFVSQREDGVWDVVDGIQRLSTLYELVGILKDENNKIIPPLKLERTRYLPSLEGMEWESQNPEKSLTPEQKLIIKRTKIAVSIVLRESDQFAKFELFQRLNTGGSLLTPQEVRNCILVMANPYFQDRLNNLSKHQSFQDTIALSQKNLDEQYDVELALRFIVFSTIDIEIYNRSADVGDYLTDQMVILAQDEKFNWEETENRFRATFDYIYEVLKDNAFRRYTIQGFKGGFLLSPFEVIAFGLGYNFPNFPSPENTLLKVKHIYGYDTYTKWSGSGVRANSRLPHLIPFGRELFRQ